MFLDCTSEACHNIADGLDEFGTPTTVKVLGLLKDGDRALEDVRFIRMLQASDKMPP